MKKSILKAVLLFVLILVLFSIAIPTIVFKWGDGYKRIRGIDPQDFNKDAVIKEFTFRPSIDLQGGKIVTFNVDMSSVEISNRKDNLENAKDIIFSRLINSRISNFELNSLVNEEKNEYKIILKFPNNINQDLMQVLITPGNISFYADDSLNQTDNASDPNSTQNKPYGNRIITSLTNTDIESVKVVSDARCYFNDINTPRNYCLAIQFNQGSAKTFQSALYNNPTPRIPLLVVIDGAPVGVQTGGQIFNPTTPGRELLVYPVVDDTWFSTSIIGSLMNTTPLTSVISQEQINDLKPLLQENILTTVKVSLLVAFTLGDILILIYFRKKGSVAVIASVIFLIINIAFMKIFNLILDLPLIFGFMLSYSLFMSLIIGFLFRIRTASKSGLVEDEIMSNFDNLRFEYRNLALIIILVSFVMSVFGTIFSVSLYTGFTFGVILGFVIIYYAFPIVLPIIFLNSKKWQIW